MRSGIRSAIFFGFHVFCVTTVALPARAVADDAARIFPADAPLRDPAPLRTQSAASDETSTSDFDAGTQPPATDLGPHPDQGIKLPEWAVGGLLTVREAIMYFMNGFIPDPNGIEKPNPIEWPIDQFLVRIRDAHGAPTRFQVLGQGVANLKTLGRSYLYSEVQAGAGLQVDLIDPRNPDTMLALRLSPAYIEASWIRVTAGSGPTAGGTGDQMIRGAEGGLPSRVLAGSSAGFEASHRLEIQDLPLILTPGARFYARPLWEVGDLAAIGGTRDSGVSLYGSVYVKVDLTPLLQSQGARDLRMSLTPAFAVFDRGQAIRDLVAWDGARRERPIAARGVGDLTPLWQGTLYFDLRFDETRIGRPRFDAFDGPR